MSRKKTMLFFLHSFQKFVIIALIIFNDFNKKWAFITLNKFIFKLIIKKLKSFNVISFINILIIFLKIIIKLS